MNSNTHQTLGALEGQTIFAVSCGQPVILSREEIENIKVTYNAIRKTKEEREQLAREVKALFAKPVKI